MPPTPLPPVPVRHSRAGLASMLCFQLVIVAFSVLILIASAELAPAWLGTGRAALHRGLRWGFILTLPVALVGAVFGLVGSLQMRRRKLLGLLGAVLNGMHVLLSLLVLSWM